MVREKNTLARDLAMDYIVVIPYSSNIKVIDNRLTPVLSVLSRISIDAAAALWQHHKNATMVIVGETCYGCGFPNTADLMKRRILEETQIPESSIITLDNIRGVYLNNTSLQVEGLANFSLRRQPSKIVTLALKYHIERIAVHARAYGVQTNYIAAEDILSQNHRMGEYAQYLPYMKGVERSEKWLRLLAKANPKGSIFNAIMKRKGPRVVDVVETQEKKLEFVDTFARTRLEEEKKKLVNKNGL